MGIMFFNECIGSLELGSVVDGKVGVGMFLVSRVLLVLSIENYLGLIVLVIVVVNQFINQGLLGYFQFKVFMGLFQVILLVDDVVIIYQQQCVVSGGFYGVRRRLQIVDMWKN